ncbi:MAG: hypothetical protein KGZ58_07120 [Ignavibacteriales bacterium]|nr:hypothetical protein [Ignavibacteriales bacterium]
MTYKCPVCNETGTNQEFIYLGNQQMQHKVCGNILETAAQCPNGHIMIAKRGLFEKLIPGIAAINFFRGKTPVICRDCGFKGELTKDFNIVLFFGNKKTINKRK